MNVQKAGSGGLSLLAAAVLVASPVTAPGQKEEVPAGEDASLVADLDGGNFIFMDEPGDGAIWARGPSYKASFSAEGFTYVPFLGSEAPRNFPVRFTPSFVGVGEANLLSGSLPVPQRVGENRVVYDHGAFQEIYEIRLDGVEQLFTLPSGAGAGDLVVRMEVESDLDFVGVREGKHVFEAPGLGGVKYGEAHTVDAAAVGRPATVVYDGNALEVRVPSSAVADATYPLTIDPIISTFSVAPGNFLQFDPDVSYNTGGMYTYTWEHAFSSSDHDIWSRIRTIAGTLGAYVAQDITTTDWRNPTNADNNKHNRVLVVAAADAFPLQTDLRGRMFSPITNTNVSAQFDLTSDIWTSDYNADVGGDPRWATGDLFCVVWERFVPPFGQDIHSRTVHATTLQLGSVQNIANSLEAEALPAISKGCGLVNPHWYVGYEHRTLPTNLVSVRASVLAPNGTIVYSSILGGGVDPDVASTGDSALYVYEKGMDIHGGYLTGLSSGTPSWNFINLTANELNSDPGEWQRNPTVGVDECRFVYAYSESYNGSQTDLDIRLAALRPSASGFVWDQGHVLVPNAFTTAREDNPAITSRWTAGGSGPEYAVVFDDNNTPGTGWYEIHAALYEAHSGALTTTTVPTACGAPAPTIAVSGTSALNGTLSVQSTAGQGGARLLLAGAPGSTPLCAGPGSCTLGMSSFPSVILPGGSLAGTIPCNAALAGAVMAFQVAEYGTGLAGGCDISGVSVLLSNTIDVTFSY
jgi:hypothetical protein